MPKDLSYFLIRASEERTAALRQPDPRVRQAHLELAERYEERVRDIASQPEPLFFPSRGTD